MTPTESRKRLLIAESDINRAQLLIELAAIRSGMGQLSDKAKSLGSIASSAAFLVTGLALFLGGTTAKQEPKRSWPQRLMKGAGLISTLWFAFRPKDHTKSSGT